MTEKRPSRHIKIPGYVESVEPPRWTAILRAPGGDLIADMIDPLPADRGVGYLFTLHKTKRGHTYLFWPPIRPWSPSKRRRHERKARAWAKEVMKAFDLSDFSSADKGS